MGLEKVFKYQKRDTQFIWTMISNKQGIYNKYIVYSKLVIN